MQRHPENSPAFAIAIRHPILTGCPLPADKEFVAMLEIEVKYAVADWTGLERQVQQSGGQHLETRRDIDLYFNAPDRDFVQTDEAFRLRRIGQRNFLTYKGPKRDATTKTRAEIEVPLPDGNISQHLRLIEALGYRAVATVTKDRIVYQWPREGYDLHVCFDAVEEVGSYVELEIVAPPAEEERAREVVLRAARELSLLQVERRSYIHLLILMRGGT